LTLAAIEKETFPLFRDEGAAAALALFALNGECFGINALPDLENSKSCPLRPDPPIYGTPSPSARIGNAQRRSTP
jgi:hypothetical protein